MQPRGNKLGLWIIGVFLVLAIIPVSNCMARTRPRNSSQWSTMSSTHFLIYFRPSIRRRAVYGIRKKAEHYYRKIVQDLGLMRSKYWIWSDRCKIYIYKDLEDYKENSKVPEWSSGCASPELREIYIYPEQEHLEDVILPHEMTHIIFYEARGGVEIPNCVDEGVAMREEKSHKRVEASKWVVAKSFAENKYIPLEKLFGWEEYYSMSDEIAQLFYAESCLFLEFLLSEYPRSYFATFCWRLKTGKNFYDAFRMTYNRYNAFNKVNMDKLNEDYVAFVVNHSRSYIEYFRRKNDIGYK